MSERHLNDHCNLVLIQYCRPYRSVPYCPVAVVVQSIFMETISSFFFFFSCCRCCWRCGLFHSHLSLFIFNLQFQPSFSSLFVRFPFCMSQYSSLQLPTFRQRRLSLILCSSLAIIKFIHFSSLYCC